MHFIRTLEGTRRKHRNEVLDNVFARCASALLLSAPEWEVATGGETKKETKKETEKTWQADDLHTKMHSPVCYLQYN